MVRLRFRFLVGAFLIIATQVVISSNGQTRTLPYRFLIPEGYVGWIRVDFDVSGAPRLPIEDGFYIFEFPESGRLQDFVERRG